MATASNNPDNGAKSAAAATTPGTTPTAAAGRTYTSPIPTKKSSAFGKSNIPRGNQTFLFDRSNYMWMGIGLACILLGFMLMSGGKSPDPHVFNFDEVFSTRRITIAPIMLLIGFGIEVYAIMKKRPVTGADAEVKE